MENQDITNHLALAIIDIQDPFIGMVPDSETLIKRVSFAIEASELLEIKIIATEQLPDKLGRTHPDIKKLLKDAPMFEKSSFSISQADGFEEYIEKESIEHLMITGLEIPICVYQSCIDLINCDKDITILSDCVTGRRTEDWDPVRQSLVQSGCHWLPSEAVFYSILNDAGHPKFRDFTKIVKKYS